MDLTDSATNLDERLNLELTRSIISVNSLAQLMNRVAALTSLLATIAGFGPQSVHAQSASPAKITEIKVHRSRILDNRVRELLHYRVEGLRLCLKRQASNEVRLLSDEIGMHLLSPSVGDENETLDSLALYQQTQVLLSRKVCVPELHAADQKPKVAEREPFQTAISAFYVAVGAAFNPLFNPKALARAIVLVEEMNPWCATRVGSAFNKTMGKNNCYAGDSLALNALQVRNTSFPRPVREWIETFTLRLDEAVAQAAQGSTIDLLALYSGARPGAVNREEFLAANMLLFTATRSTAGYVDHFGDFAWQAELATTGAANLAYEAYVRHLQVIDLAHRLELSARRKKLRFIVGGNGELTLQHHNLMASYLGCHFVREGSTTLAWMVPRLAGIFYEARDFGSHLKEGFSLGESIRNFSTDTARYRDSALWGARFCK
jgi:hypothetical protein